MFLRVLSSKMPYSFSYDRFPQHTIGTNDIIFCLVFISRRVMFSSRETVSVPYVPLAILWVCNYPFKLLDTLSIYFLCRNLNDRFGNFKTGLQSSVSHILRTFSSNTLVHTSYCRHVICNTTLPSLPIQ